MSWRDAVTLVARREIRERLRGRALLFSTLFALLLVAGATAVPGITPEKTYDVGVVAPAPASLEVALERAAEPFEAKVELRELASASAGRQALEREDVDALLLLGDDRLIFRAEVDTELAAVADSAVRALRRHLPPEPELTVAALEPVDAESTDAEVFVAMVGAGSLLLALSIYGQWVLVGVAEEKSNRVVEVILATMPPRHLLAGKVIGIGLLGLAQFALVAGLAAALVVTGAFDAPAGLGWDIALVVPWFALGFALYAVAFAAVGALTSRQQDASTAGQPVTLTLVAVYFVGYAVLDGDPEGALAQALTVFPPSAPLVLPARSALVGVPLWQHVLAVALVVASTYALVRFAGRAYARGLLQSRGGGGIRAVWRLARQA